MMQMACQAMAGVVEPVAVPSSRQLVKLLLGGVMPVETPPILQTCARIVMPDACHIKFVDACVLA